MNKKHLSSFVIYFGSIFLAYKLFDKYPELLWIFIPIWIYLIFLGRGKASQGYITSAHKIKKDIDDYVEREICIEDEKLLKKYKTLCSGSYYGFPPLNFTKLIKDLEKRNKYCTLSISMIKEYIKFHERFIHEENLNPQRFLSNFQTHTIITISIIIGAIGVKVFGLIGGVVSGAIAYWAINEYQINTRKSDQTESYKAKHLAEINTITKEWEEILNQYQSFLG